MKITETGNRSGKTLVLDAIAASNDQKSPNNYLCNSGNIKCMVLH